MYIHVIRMVNMSFRKINNAQIHTNSTGSNSSETIPAKDPGKGSRLSMNHRGDYSQGVRQSSQPHCRTTSAAVRNLPDRGGTERAEICRLATAVAQGTLEVLAGSRAPHSLHRVLATQPLESLTTRADLLRRARATEHCPQLRSAYRSSRAGSVHPCHISPGVYEVSVVVREAPRCRALALRLEQHNGEWIVTVLLIG